ncbi:MAG: hypothetical protein K0U20_09280 [Proteobacteria bacterium]|nr:hypothetical protein [Pseudomonadota bacterium]MCH9735772.1 hypothetical protein [Actinomycetes bacterium]
MKYSKIILEWELPFTEGFKGSIPKNRNGNRGIDAHDFELLWIIQDCKLCSQRDKKIAKIILDARLQELEELL